ncbi:MAG: hypothetical protein H7641_14035, partial [Candidatus Heimdallarchaeota archaeon]|nr:hypothetical protein [Candidatus Heimdallarchaeota archaeon]MCK4878682.1 hypothetical protein [Candidatus Heimdallarchaeota archaeon]
MVLINENIVMSYYLELMKNDEINFLIGKEEAKKTLEKQIKKMQATEEIHDKIQEAKKIWKLLFEHSMTFLDKDKQGYDELFKYFDEFVNFEELIFASDSFYRDHTLHCLWVYFLGEYVFHKPEFGFLLQNFNRHLRIPEHVCKYFEALEAPNIFGGICVVLQSIAQMLHYEDSSRCIIALTHDLGYPLKKIAKINKSIGKILPFFSISRFDQFTFQFETIQQIYIENLLELLSFSISLEVDMGDLPYEERQSVLELINRLNQLTDTLLNLQDPDEELFEKMKNDLKSVTDKEADVLRRIYTVKATLQKNVSAILRFSNDFENYKHGILSSYLLMKTLNSFSNLRINTNLPINLPVTEIDIPSINSKLSILRAIANHTSQGFQITDITTYSEMLVLFDEIEEFSRISRANQFRQFINEFCKTDIGVEDGYLKIDFIFDDPNVADLDPEISFRDKCMKFMNFFDIENLNDNIKIKFRCIGKLPNNKNIYEVIIERGLIEISINGEGVNPAEYLKTKE